MHGGALWAGAAIDPINQYLFIPVNNIPWILRNLIFSKGNIYTSFPDEMKNYHNIYVKKCSGCHGKKRNGVSNKKGEKLIKRIRQV